MQWGDDSVESLSEGSPSRSEKIHLPTPKKRAVSPLKKQEIRKFARRRKIKKWSSLEEETLRTAVKKYVFAWERQTITRTFFPFLFERPRYLLLILIFLFLFGKGSHCCI